MISRYKVIICALRNYNFNSREKIKPGPGFELWTSRFIVWGSTIWSILVQWTVQIYESLFWKQCCSIISQYIDYKFVCTYQFDVNNLWWLTSTGYKGISSDLVRDWIIVFFFTFGKSPSDKHIVFRNFYQFLNIHFRHMFIPLFCSFIHPWIKWLNTTGFSDSVP